MPKKTATSQEHMIKANKRNWLIDERRHIRLYKPAQIMCIINVTPDSFSDGGLCYSVDAAVAQARAALEAGAICLDVGGESTRPGAEPVSVEEETRRVLPVIEAMQSLLIEYPQAYISIDTSKASVARAALQAGAAMINDVSAARDPEMFAVAAEFQAAMILMHMQGTPLTMQHAPQYDNVVDEQCAFFEERMKAAEAAGIAREALVLDPGIGFGKKLEHNLTLMRSLSVFEERLARPLLMGISRKSFIPLLLGKESEAMERDAISHIIHAQLAPQCSLLRVHDAAGAAAALKVSKALSNDKFEAGELSA